MRHFCAPTGRIGRFLSHQKGMAAVEFALIAPVLLFLYLGATDLTQALAIDRKLGLFASTVSDLVAQEKGISNNDIRGMVDAGTAIMRPFSTDDTELRLTVFDLTDGPPNVTCNWATAAAPASGALPQEMLTLAAGHYVVLATTWYEYQPMFGTVFNASVPLEQHSLHIVRQDITGTFGC